MRINDATSVIALNRGALAATLEAVAHVSGADLRRPTPCPAWDLDALLRHMTGQHRGFAASARGDRTSPQDFASTHDADPVAAYRMATEEVEQAFADLTPGDQMWLPELSDAAPFPALLAVGFHTIDNVIHAWDVAHSVGYPLTVPDSVVEPTLNLARSLPASRGEGAPFLAEVQARPDVGLLEQLLAWSGRDPAA